jgi:hypothetical protein
MSLNVYKYRKKTSLKNRTPKKLRMDNTEIFNYNSTLAEFMQITVICEQNSLCLGIIYIIMLQYS